MTELVIKGGTVCTPDGPREADVLVTDGVIARVDSNIEAAAGAKVVDAAGMFVLPGAVDVHVHSRDPGFPEKEDFGTLTAAAAAGGVTTVLDMPNTVPAVDGAGVLEAKAALARGKARVDFGLWGIIRSTSSEEQLESLADGGAVGFKAYLGYAFSVSRKQVLQSPAHNDPDLEAPPDYGTLVRLAPALARIGLPVAIHAEDPGVLRAFQRPILNYQDLLESRPPEAEAVAISAAAVVARESGLHLHVAHLSSAMGLQAVEDALRAGTNLTAETCPQFLLLTDQDFDRVGAHMKMLPPVRTPADRDSLIDGLRRGAISIVGTDHAPHTDEEKARQVEDALSGTPGVQTLYLSCLEIASGLGDVWQAVRWVSERPAELAGLQDSKGAISAGYDADIVIVDPGRKTTVRPADMKSKQRHGALEGKEFGFAIKEVFLRGESVSRRARVHGRWVRPARRAEPADLVRLGDVR
ncbi:MAG TPA: dihydroorotase family protein [Candidatus Dormibacteraeota bacterium]|nr:dihydroorotase family protein [Candidatus Dormibacteraeota bacterium]